MLDEIQSRGLPASVPYFEALQSDMEVRARKIQKVLSKYLTHINPGSHKDVAVLMDLQGLVGAKRTKTGAYSTSKDSIGHLRFKNAAIGLVFDWRETRDIITKFCIPIIRSAGGNKTSRVFHTVKYTRTTSGRLAAKDLNVLAMPSRGDLGLRIRKGFIAPKGYRLGGADYSQIELRVAAHFSQDRLLCDRFNRGCDVHSETAAEIFGIDLKDVDKIKHRLPTKNVAFGILFGIQGPGLYTLFRKMGIEKFLSPRGLEKKWSDRECQRLIKEYLLVYKGLAVFIENVKRQLYNTGYVRCAGGMIRRLPAIWDSKSRNSAEAGRMGVSHIIQGSAQWMIQNAMQALYPKIVKLRKKGIDVWMVLQLHDELMAEFPRKNWKKVRKVIVNTMERNTGMELRVPIVVDSGMNKSWGGLK